MCDAGARRHQATSCAEHVVVALERAGSTRAAGPSLWGNDAPASGVKTVQVYVSRLRKAFDDPEVLVTTPAGYRLRVRPGELDAERFERLVDEGRHALEVGRAEHAAAVLHEALALWRGPPLVATSATGSRSSW